MSDEEALTFRQQGSVDSEAFGMSPENVEPGKPVWLTHNRALAVTMPSGDVLTILPGDGMKRAPIRLKGAAKITHRELR